MDVRDFTLLLGSQDLPRLERFYDETLGLERLPSQHHVVFRLPGGKLRLIEHSEVAEHAREPQRLQINLFIDDVRSEAARLEPLGVKLVRPLSQMAWGGWLVTLEDPDGNYVQLIEGS